MPFAEIPSLRNMVLTGHDDGDMSYMRLQERNLAQGALMSPSRPSDNNSMVPYGGGQRGGRGRGYSDDRRPHETPDHYGGASRGGARCDGNSCQIGSDRGGYGGRYDNTAAGRGGGIREEDFGYEDEQVSRRSQGPQRRGGGGGGGQSGFRGVYD